MKKFIKFMLRPIVCNRVGRRVIASLYKLGHPPPEPEEPATETGEDTLYRPIVAGMTVLHGPFKGMRYPTFESIGSTFYPKILGSYEREIGHLIESICHKNYSSIVDIGCAEGYYAVGFGMRIPEAKIYAFDTDSRALELCQEMANINGVSIQTGEFCSKETLTNLDLGPRALIMSDCEGYEIELFDKSLAEHLKSHDFLIESHDCFNITTTQYLHSVFKSTHKITEIESIDDILKAYRYEYAELSLLNLDEKCHFLSEGRPSIMRWLYMEAK